MCATDLAPAVLDVVAAVAARRPPRVPVAPAPRRPGPPRVAVLTGGGGAAHLDTAPALLRLAEGLRGLGAEARYLGEVPLPCTAARHVQPVAPVHRHPAAVAAEVALRSADPDVAVVAGACDAVVPSLVVGALRAGPRPVAVVPVTRSERRDPVWELVWRVTGLHAEADVAPAELPGRVLGLSGAGAPLDPCRLVDGLVAVLAAGGSVPHLLHLVALGAAAGIPVRWSDVEALSAVVPVEAGPVEVAALVADGLLHGRGGERPSAARPRTAVAGRRVQIVEGNLGEAVVDLGTRPRTPAVHAPARVFDDVRALRAAVRSGDLHRDVVVVLRGLDGTVLDPAGAEVVRALARVAALGHTIALVTDGAVGGAAAGLLVAEMLTPGVAARGPVERVRNGDDVLLDAQARKLEVPTLGGSRAA